MQPGVSEPGRVPGTPARYHDIAAALLQDGKILAEAHEERFTCKNAPAAHASRGACLTVLPFVDPRLRFLP